MPFEERLGEILKWTILVGFPPLLAIQMLREFVPPLEFWLTLGPLAWIATFIVGFILGVLGITMRDWPKGWVIGLMALGGVALFLGGWSAAEQAQKLAEQDGKLARITGDKNYAYFHSRKGQKRAGKFLLYLKGIGDSPDVRICIYRLADDGRQYGEICPPEITIRAVNAEIGWEIPAGRWQFHFSAQYNNRWIQTLIFSEGFQVLEEVIDVRREGEPKSLYSHTKFYPIRLESNVTR